MRLHCASSSIKSGDPFVTGAKCDILTEHLRT